MKASNGKVVIACLNGEMLIRRLERTFNKIRLVPETTPPVPHHDVDLLRRRILGLGRGDVRDPFLVIVN